MVDFNNETTITSTPKNILHILILQERDELLSSIGAYYNISGGEISNLKTKVRSRLIVLYLELKSAIKRDLKGDYNKIETLVWKGETIEEYIEALNLINDWLDQKKLTRFDIFDSYDRTRVERQNVNRGL